MIMQTQTLFYSFDTKSKPGKIVCHGVRFVSQEIDGAMIDAKLPILCIAHKELENVPIDHFKIAVAKNL
jgi:hypothetical protein